MARGRHLIADSFVGAIWQVRVLESQLQLSSSQSTPNFVHGDVDQAAFYQHLQQPVSIYGPPSVKGEVLQGPIQTVQTSEKISRNSKKMQKYEKVGITTQYIMIVYMIIWKTYSTCQVHPIIIVSITAEQTRLDGCDCLLWNQSVPWTDYICIFLHL